MANTASTPDAFSDGQSVIWDLRRGGYGFILPVPATVVCCKGDRAKVAVPLSDGSTVQRWVRVANLRAKEAHRG